MQSRQKRPWAFFRKDKPGRLLFFFHETTWSGAPIQLLHLISWLKARGWEIAAAVPDLSRPEAGPITTELERAGIGVFPVLDLSRGPDLEALGCLCRDFDFVIANTLVTWAAVQAARNEKIATIWYIHESLVAHQLLRQAPQIEPTLALADLLVMPTERTAALYRSLTERPIEVVPYGIPAGKISAPSKRQTDRAKCNFLLLGSYEHRKGQDVFLGAIRCLPGALQEQAVFRLAGRTLDPQFFEVIARDAAALPSVELLPSLEHDQALAAVAACDVLVCASRDETMPVAILEAMSLGKAIVATDVGGIGEWLSNDKTALMVPAEDTVALGRALTRCIEEPKLREALGRKAQRLFYQNFSLDRLGKRFTALIDRALRMSR